MQFIQHSANKFESSYHSNSGIRTRIQNLNTGILWQNFFLFFADVKHVTELCETSKKEDHWYSITGQITCNSNVIFCVYIRDAVSFMDHVHLLISLHVGEVVIDCMHH